MSETTKFQSPVCGKGGACADGGESWRHGAGNAREGAQSRLLGGTVGTGSRGSTTHRVLQDNLHYDREEGSQSAGIER